MDPDLLRGNLNLILLSILEEGSLYGFAISQKAKTRTDGYFDFKEGSLYPALHRLEHAGLLSAEFGELGRNGKPRKYYRLTESGHRELQSRRQEFQTFASAIGRLTGV